MKKFNLGGLKPPQSALSISIAKATKPELPEELQVPFTPFPGAKCFVWTPGKPYRNAVVLSLKDDGKAKVKFGDGTTEYVPMDWIEAPPTPPVAERFSMYEKVVTLASRQRVKSLVVLGQPGLGKSYTIDMVFKQEGMTPDADFIEVKGHSTPFDLYKTLFDYKDHVVVFDDCDSVLKDATSTNILKAVLDTTGKRRVSWKSKALEVSSYPDSFAFNGTVIFVSNMSLDKIPRPLISRSVCIDLYMDKSEIIERMKMLLPFIIHNVEGAAPHHGEKVMQVMEVYADNIAGLNLRSLVLGISVYAQSGSLELVKYQLLNMTSQE